MAYSVKTVLDLQDVNSEIKRLAAYVDAQQALDLSAYVALAGAQTITGQKAFSLMPNYPSATVAAAGTTQANGGVLTTGFSLVSAADGTKGVVLPVAIAGAVCIIKNNAAAALKVWPAVGDAINAAAVDALYSMGNLTSAVFVAFDATTWYTVPLVAS